MKYIKNFEQFNENIIVPIKVGDTIYGGRFKNKKTIVKKIGKNSKGDITINGKPLLKFRIIKENNENVYDADFIIDYITNISDTPETDVPDYYFDVIKNNNREFVLRKMKIDDILNSDESLKEYVDYGEDRYEDSDYDHEFNSLDNPIVILDGQVIDGYNRTLIKFQNDETEIDAYVSL